MKQETYTSYAHHEHWARKVERCPPPGISKWQTQFEAAEEKREQQGQFGEVFQPTTRLIEVQL